MCILFVSSDSLAKFSELLVMLLREVELLCVLVAR